MKQNKSLSVRVWVLNSILSLSVFVVFLQTSTDVIPLRQQFCSLPLVLGASLHDFRWQISTNGNPFLTLNPILPVDSWERDTFISVCWLPLRRSGKHFATKGVKRPPLVPVEVPEELSVSPHISSFSRIIFVLVDLSPVLPALWVFKTGARFMGCNHVGS